MAQRHSIPHFKRLIVDSKIPEGQGRGNIRSLPCPLLLKSTFFTKSGRGRPITKPRPQSSGFKMPIIRAFKLNENQNQQFRCVIAIEHICI